MIYREPKFLPREQQFFHPTLGPTRRNQHVKSLNEPVVGNDQCLIRYFLVSATQTITVDELVGEEHDI